MSHCKNPQHHDVRLFFHALYDWEEDLKTNVADFVVEWCGHWFEDLDDWGDSYYEKHTRKGQKFFMPKNAQRAVARYIKKHKIKLT